MKDTLKTEIGERMATVRDTLGLTQEDMSKFFPVGRADLSRIEKGEVFPNPVLLNVLRTQFGISLDWLIANKGKMFIPEKERTPLKEQIKSKNMEEMQELLYFIQKIPMVKHAILGFYLEYKIKHKDVIQDHINNSEDDEIKEAFPTL